MGKARQKGGECEAWEWGMGKGGGLAGSWVLNCLGKRVGGGEEWCRIKKKCESVAGLEAP